MHQDRRQEKILLRTVDSTTYGKSVLHTEGGSVDKSPKGVRWQYKKQVAGLFGGFDLCPTLGPNPGIGIIMHIRLVSRKNTFIIPI